MPPKNNIELGSGQIYFKGIDEMSQPFDISDVVLDAEVEYADEHKPIKIPDTMEATFECDLQINREWTLAYCRVCRQPIPIIQFDALIYGTEGWTCPLRTTIARVRRRDA